jgi:hypothetical protein
MCGMLHPLVRRRWRLNARPGIDDYNLMRGIVYPLPMTGCPLRWLPSGI